MKKLLVLAVVALMMLAIGGCGKNNGSNAGLKGNVSTNGSTSMEYVVGILSEKFMSDNSGINISYDATGSGTGIEAVSKGNCDIGLASRKLKDSEKAKGLKEETIALDGIAVIVNENSDLSDIRLEDLARIFNGSVRDWSSLGSKAGKVAAIGREAGSGTREGFESITKTKDKCLLTQELTSTGAVIEAVKNSEGAIGYVSFASAKNQKGVKVLKINGVECNEDNISSGKYAVQRPFNLVTRSDKVLSEAAQAFYNFMVSKEAARLITDAGAVPAAK